MRKTKETGCFTLTSGNGRFKVDVDLSIRKAGLYQLTSRNYWTWLKTVTIPKNVSDYKKMAEGLWS